VPQLTRCSLNLPLWRRSWSYWYWSNHPLNTMKSKKLSSSVVSRDNRADLRTSWVIYGTTGLPQVPVLSFRTLPFTVHHVRYHKYSEYLVRTYVHTYAWYQYRNVLDWYRYWRPT
jgi:hypothetical protein